MKAIRGKSHLLALLPAVLLFLGACGIVVAAGEPDEGTITIHKYLVDASRPLALAGDGREITDPDGRTVYQGDDQTTLSDLAGINGIEFTVLRVRDGTTDPDNALPHTGPGAYSETLRTRNVNGQDGVAVFAGLPEGTYLVEEQASAFYEGADTRFLLTVPLPDPAGGGVLHDIHVYPKNWLQSKLTISAREYYVRAGGEAVWTFRWELPGNIGQGEELTLTDPLDERLALAFRDGAPRIAMRYGDRLGEVHPLDPKHYSFQLDRAQRVLIVSVRDASAFALLSRALLPDDGLECPYLYLELVTGVGQDATGVIYNAGSLSFSDRTGGVFSTRTQEDACIEAIGSGGICIYKYDGNSGQALAGAQFEVYGSAAAARARRDPIPNPAAQDGAWPPTDDTGYTLISDLLFVGDGSEYWVVETRAPVVDGKSYQLLADPVRVWVNARTHLPQNRLSVANYAETGGSGGDGNGGQSGGAGDGAPESQGSMIIPETPSPAPPERDKLIPIAGGGGAIRPMLVGAALLCAAGVLAHKLRKRGSMR